MNPNQIPDWDWHQSRLSDDAIEVLDRLDDLRRDHPIIWAITTGHKTTLAIANGLAMPYEIVLYELDRYRVNERRLSQEASDLGIVWRLRDDDDVAMMERVRRLKRNNRTVRDNT